ncbi:prophage CP4-57 regulatory family protein [Vibrio cholerae]|nr:prophage CP4-57 regulatory family protein [Vibrio cholerae]
MSKSNIRLIRFREVLAMTGLSRSSMYRSGPQFSDMTLSGRSVLIVPNNTGTDYD